MSIVDEAGERVILERGGERMTLTPIKSAKVRERNRRWLAIKRQFNMSVRELAGFLNRHHATVARGVRWAAEEEMARSFEDAAARDPEIDPVTGLTVEDVLYLARSHPPGSDLGSHPEFRAIVDPLLDKILEMTGGSDPASSVVSRPGHGGQSGQLAEPLAA